jgi:hypothetical protein
MIDEMSRSESLTKAIPQEAANTLTPKGQLGVAVSLVGPCDDERRTLRIVDDQSGLALYGGLDSDTHLVIVDLPKHPDVLKLPALLDYGNQMRPGAGIAL